MYVTRDNIKLDNTNFADVKDIYKPFISYGWNILKMYFPNKSKFKIKKNCPFLKNFWDLTKEIIFEKDNFEETLWEKSFSLEDKI